MAELGVNEGGGGSVTTFKTSGETLVKLNSNPEGGTINLFNIVGESVASMYATKDGNGVVYAGNREGMGRTLDAEPWTLW